MAKAISFKSRLDRISTEMEYFAVPVPARVSAALGTRAAIPVRARVNDSKDFRGSLVPDGEGGHFMRVKAEVRREARVKEGDRVRVEFTVVDRAAEAAAPRDVMKALRAAGVTQGFESLPPGKRGFLLRQVEAAAKAETREKRIAAVVEEAQKRQRA